MNESTMSGQLLMRWLPVTDPTGRTHLEAVWVQSPSTPHAVGHAA